MRATNVAVGLIVGVVLGVVATAYTVGQTVRRNINQNANDPKLVQAGSNDRFEDYVLCTGSVAVTQRASTDGLWLLDYRAGKLLGTVIDRSQGKIQGWAELNIAQDFQIPPKQNAHFMMTTGTISQGQSALYVVETTTGKFGVYTLGQDTTGQQAGWVIRKHDQGFFRQQAAVKN